MIDIKSVKLMLSIAEVEAVLAAPEQQVPGYGGRLVYQSRGSGFLVRVVVEQDRSPREVVTAYLYTASVVITIKEDPPATTAAPVADEPLGEAARCGRRDWIPRARA